MKRFSICFNLALAVSLGLLLLALSRQTVYANPGGTAAPGAPPVASAANGHLAYVTLPDSNLVALVDTNTYTVTGSIDVGVAGCNYPWQVEMSPDGSAVYVSCLYSNSIAVIETTHHTIVTVINDINGTSDIAFSHDGAYAVLSLGYNGVAIMDTATFSVIHTIPISSQVLKVATHSHLNMAYAACNDGTIRVIDTTTFAIVASIQLGYYNVQDVIVSPDGQWVLASDYEGNGLAVIDAVGYSVYTTLTGLGSLASLDVAPDGSVLYAAGLGGGVYVFDTATFSRTAAIGGIGNAWELAVTCNGKQLIVGNSSAQLPVIDTATLSVTHQVALPGNFAHSVAVCPQARQPSVLLAPKAQTGYVEPGQTITYPVQLINTTGYTDSFTLELLPGAAWTSTLPITSTGPLADGEDVTFTVQVDIPSSATPGDSDAVSLQATSVTSPTVYSATARLHTLAAGSEFAYITLTSSDVVAVMDTATHVVVDSLYVGSSGCTQPWQAEMSPDGGFVYVSCLASSSMVVIETTGNSIVATISGLSDAGGIAFTHDGAYALVSMSYNGVAIVDTVTFSVINTVSTPDYTHKVATHPYLDLAYATCNNNTIQVIDTTSFSIVANIPLNDYPTDVAVSPDGQWVFVSQSGARLTVIDATAYTIYTTLATPKTLGGLATSPDGLALYVGSSKGSVYVIDTATFNYTAVIDGVGNAQDLAITCDGSQLLVSNYSNQLPIIDTHLYSVTHQVALPGTGSRGIAICSQARRPGLLLSPKNQAGHAEPGHTATYQARLANTTGQTDSFILELLPGAAWTSTLPITSTGPLAHGGIFSFTIQVDIPASALPGDSDSVNLQATSVNSPTVYSATAMLETLATGSQRAYVAMADSDLVALVDSDANIAVGSIDVGAAGCDSPQQAEMAPDGAAVYVSCYDSNNVVVIETTNNTVVATVADIYSAGGIAFTRDGSYALVSMGYYGIAVVDTASFSVLTTISTPGGVRRVAVHPHLDLAYAICDNRSLLVIDTTTFAIVASTPLSDLPWDVATSPDGRWVYLITQWGINDLIVVDAGTYTIHTNITNLGNMTSLAVAPDGSAIYLGDSWGVIHVVDAATFSPTAAISLVGDAVELAVACDGGQLVVSNGNNQVTVIDTTTSSVIRPVTLPGNGAGGIAICPPAHLNRLLIAPQKQPGYARPGHTITYPIRLSNFTGQTDSFTFGLLSGGAWTSTLSITSTGPLAYGQVLTFTVQVEVPSSASPGETNTINLQATSVNSPTVYSATTEVQTTAIGDQSAYVALSESDTVAVIDMATHAVVDNINVGAAGCDNPSRAAIAPDGSYVYISCLASNQVVVIETANNTILTTTAIYYAEDVAFTHDGRFALISSSYNGVAVMDTATFSVVHTIPTPDRALKIATHPYLNLAYVICYNYTIQIIDTTSFAIVASTSLSNAPQDIAISPDGRWVYVSSSQWGANLIVIDAVSYLVQTEVTGLDGLTSLAVAQDGSVIYAGNVESSIYVMDAGTFTPVATIGGVENVQDMALTCDGEQLYVGNGGDQLPIIDTALYTVTQQVKLPGSGAYSVAACPQHYGSVYTATQTGIVPGAWYDFIPTCARLYFTDTGSLQPITVSVTLRHAFPTAHRDGLPRRYDITSSSSGFQAMLAACYQDFDLSAAGIPISDEVNLHLYQYAGSPDWSEFSSVDPVHNLITATGVTSFGVWGLGIPGDHPTAVSLQRAQAAVKAHSGWLAVLLGLCLAGAGWVRRRRARR